MKREKKRRGRTHHVRIRVRACASSVFNACYPAEPQSAFAADAKMCCPQPTGWRFPVTRFGANQQAHAWFRNCKTFSHSCDSNAARRVFPRPRCPPFARAMPPSAPFAFSIFFFFVFPYTRFQHTTPFKITRSPKKRFARPKSTRHRRAKTRRMALRDECSDLCNENENVTANLTSFTFSLEIYIKKNFK